MLMVRHHSAPLTFSLSETGLTNSICLMSVFSNDSIVACVLVHILTIVVVFQGDAGQKGAGQTRPEGSGGDCGEFS